MAALERTLGLGALSFYGIGLILGAGIYSILGEAAGAAGSGLWLAFLLASVTALLTGLSYAELSTMFPLAGAEYNYLREAWPRRAWLASVIGWALALSSTASAAAVAIAFGGYASLFTAAPGWILSVVLLLLVTALNVVGVRESTWANVLFTLVEAGGLVAFVWLGARDPEFGAALLSAPHLGVVAAIGTIFFAFLGFESIANLAEEAKRPARDVPRALLISVAVSTLLYVLVALAAVALLDPSRLAESRSPLADAARATAPGFVGALGGVALFATANTALIAIMVASRILYGMARRGDAPRAFERTLARRRTPYAALVAILAGALVLLTVGGLGIVASVASMMALIAFAAVNLALIRLRYTQPERERPFRVPIAIGRLPLLPALGALSIAVVVTQFTWPTYLLTALIAAGVGLAVALMRRQQARRTREDAPRSA